MSELALVVGTPPQQGQASQGIQDTQRKIVVRTNGKLPAGHPVNINSPGDGWTEQGGGDLSFTNTQEFLDYTQLYRNGQLLYAAETGSAEAADVYAEVSGANVLISFDYNLSTNDVITIWKFAKATA